MYLEGALNCKTWPRLKKITITNIFDIHALSKWHDPHIGRQQNWDSEVWKFLTKYSNSSLKISSFGVLIFQKHFKTSWPQTIWIYKIISSKFKHFSYFRLIHLIHPKAQLGCPNLKFQYQNCSSVILEHIGKYFIKSRYGIVPYITSAKKLGGWGQKNGDFYWRSVLFMLM